MAEGDIPGEMYVLRSGSAAVLIEDHTGTKQTVSHIGPGETIGEMSLLTKEPASATVRVDEESEVLVLDEGELADLSQRHPELERNMLRILAARLVRANYLAVGRQRGRLTVLDGGGSPPLLGYALTASIAWHTRAPTLHLALSDSPLLRARTAGRACPLASRRCECQGPAPNLSSAARKAISHPNRSRPRCSASPTRTTTSSFSSQVRRRPCSRAHAP